MQDASRGVVRAAALSLALVVSACSGEAPEAGIDPADATQVASGAQIYAQYCAACHGAEREGQPEWRRRRPDGRLPAPPHDESGHTWHHSNSQLLAMTRHGMVPPLAPDGYQSDMPAYAGVLGDDQIRAVLAYLQSTWSDEVHAYRRKMLEQQQRR